MLPSFAALAARIIENYDLVIDWKLGIGNWEFSLAFLLLTFEFAMSPSLLLLLINAALLLIVVIAVAYILRKGATFEFYYGVSHIQEPIKLIMYRFILLMVILGFIAAAVNIFLPQFLVE